MGHTAKSPLYPVEAVVARMKEQLLDVRKESEALLQKRIRDVLEINLRIEKELKIVQRKLEGIRIVIAQPRVFEPNRKSRETR